MKGEIGLTAKGIEAYWRTKIAEEIRLGMMPVCVCERCDNYAEASLIERCIEKIRNGGK